MRFTTRFAKAALALGVAPLLLAAQNPPPQGPPPDRGPAQRMERPGMGPGAGMGMRDGMGPGMRMGMRMGMGMRMRQHVPLGRMVDNPAFRERMGITTEQATKIRAQESAFAKTRIRSDADLRVKRMELEELASADQPDRALIDKKMREVSDAEFAARKAAMDNRLALRGMLTAEQREQMKQLMEERRGEWMQRDMGRGPRPDGAPGRMGPQRPPGPPTPQGPPPPTEPNP